MIKLACVILTIVILVAILGVCLMVKYATDINTSDKEDRPSSLASNIYQFPKSLLLSLKDIEKPLERFPYVAAILTNKSASWSFACFAAVILNKWLVTSAHCRTSTATHHVLIYYDFSLNFTRTHPILLWRVHEEYNPKISHFKFDIAVALFNSDLYSYVGKNAGVDSTAVGSVDVSIWKSVFSMDKATYLTNEMVNYHFPLDNDTKCLNHFGLPASVKDFSIICLDMSRYEDCFINEFGPAFHNDKLVGVLSVNPRDCLSKMSVFTNVSYYGDWIQQVTKTTGL